MKLKHKIGGMALGAALLPVLVMSTLTAIQRNRVGVHIGSELETLARQQVTSIASGVRGMLVVANELIQQQLDHGLSVARNVVDQAGGIRVDSHTVDWEITDQFSGQRRRVALPRMLVGTTWLGQTRDLATAVPVVDQVEQLVGGTCTIFQRINDAGDMLRVATNVERMDGTRAIGTYIPATNPDGTPNSVIHAVLDGKTYRGRAYVVNAWYQTVYEPLRDQAGHVIGLLYVGIKEETVQSVRQSVLNAAVGETGYVYVLGGKGDRRGRYIISKGGLRDGEDLWDSRDADGRYFIRSMVEAALKLSPGQTTVVRYPWRNAGEPLRWKVVGVTYFEPWDWIVGAGMYEDELHEVGDKVDASLGSLLTWVVAGGLLLLLAAAALAAVLSGRIARPLVRMTEAARRIAAGDLQQRAAASHDGEVGELGTAFNEMAQQIQDAQKEAQRNLNEATVKATIVERAPLNIMVADLNCTITYVNPKSLETLREIESVLPCRADEVLGKSIDFFHTHPAKQRRILADPGALPHRARFTLGHHTLELLASPITDENGRYVGPMVTWELITERVRLEQEAQARTAEIQRQQQEAESKRRQVLAVAAQVLRSAEGVAGAADALAQTAQALAAGSAQQQDTVSGTASAIQQMASSARSVSASMDELARLVTENSTALTELASSVVSVTHNADQMSQTVMGNSAAIEELAASIQSQAESAEQANRMAQQAAQVAVDGTAVVRRAMAGMERVAERVRTSAVTIGELGKSSEQISSIISVINEIAEQTNLLALNAAIEAARAGDQGRGFAVVADEVRKLAERTSKATQEIDAMIGRIQLKTRDVVGSMQEGMREVEEGTELAARSGEALEHIGSGVGQVNELMSRLSAANREQAATSDDIVNATNSMNDLVRQVAAAMGEQSQAVELVSQSSEEMRQLVERVAEAMKEQSQTADHMAEDMAQVQGAAGAAVESARAMDQSTSDLATRADELKRLANAFEVSG